MGYASCAGRAGDVSIQLDEVEYQAQGSSLS